MKVCGVVWLILNTLLLVAGQNSSNQSKGNATTPPYFGMGRAKDDAILSSIKGVIFLMCCLFAGVAIYFGSIKYNYPFTVGCFLFGVLIGLLEIHTEFVREYTAVTRMNPSDMLLVFLPILIFESSFGMDAHMFYRALPQCLLLAVFGFLLCTGLTAVVAYYFLKEYRWSWMTAIVFGSIVSATDPVAVVALLKEMKMPNTFTVLIEGESLLNDGVAIVLYELLTHHIICETQLEAGPTTIEVLKTCLGAPALGYVLGKVTEWILVRIYVSPVSEMTITLVSAYVTYFVAEQFLGISAILAVVLCGITLSANKMCISPESENLVHTDWRLLSVYANTLIFMIVGILVTVHFNKYFDKNDAGFILFTYAAIVLLRSLMIALFYPLLQRIGYGLSWKEGVILSWGGLRGAIGLALSLMFAQDVQIKKRQDNVDKVLIQVCGIIVLTLVVNANTVKYLMKLLSIKKITLVKRLSMGNAMACVSEIKEKSMRICKAEWKFMKADWSWVDRITNLKDPYKGGFYDDDPNMSSLFVPYGTCNECMAALLPYSPSSEEMEELKEASRKKVLRALKGNLWKQFRKGFLHRRSLRLLIVAANYAADTPDMYLKTEDVRTKCMKISKLSRWLEKKLSSILRKLELKKKKHSDLEVYSDEEDFRSFRDPCRRIYGSPWFEPLVLFVIVLNIVQISLDIYFMVQKKYSGAVRYSGIFFVVAYAVEIFIKASALSWNRFMKPTWNKFDLVISVHSILEGIIDVALAGNPATHTYPTHLRILIALRIFNFHLVGGLLIGILSAIRDFASSDMYYAYDIGRGFLFATETVLKKIDMIVDFGPCSKVPAAVCAKNIREMLDVLDEFEKEYPAIAVTLKSNRAARTILNRARVVVDRLKRRSLIFEDEAAEMNSILFKMIKKVVFAPRYGPFSHNFQKILEGVDWINPELAAVIYENHVTVTYTAGEVVQEAGQTHENVFIIAKGILKIVGHKPEEEKSAYQYTLPNTDSLLYFQCARNESFQDYLTKSQAIGLMGFLQKTELVTTALCEKNCELIQVDYSFLEDAKEKFDDLIFCMWKSISVKIALPLVKQQRRYRRTSSGDIFLLLQKAVLPDLTESTTLDIPSAVEDMVVVQGRVKDASTHEEFKPPSYIPSTCRQLQILGNVNKRPTVILLLLLKQTFWFHNYNHWVKPDKIEETLSLLQTEQEEPDSKHKRE